MAGTGAGTGQATTPHRIVVVGGAAAGLEPVTRLGNTLGKSGKAQFTLVEKAGTHFWKPLLHAVAAGSLDRAQYELHYLAQAHWHHFTYRFGEMIGLDRRKRAVLLGTMQDDEGRQITPPSAVPLPKASVGPARSCAGGGVAEAGRAARIPGRAGG